jgi:hypothetical protein
VRQWQPNIDFALTMSSFPIAAATQQVLMMVRSGQQNHADWHGGGEASESQQRQ